jgi:hypothetical protein
VRRAPGRWPIAAGDHCALHASMSPQLLSEAPRSRVGTCGWPWTRRALSAAAKPDLLWPTGCRQKAQKSARENPQEADTGARETARAASIWRRNSLASKGFRISPNLDKSPVSPAAPA